MVSGFEVSGFGTSRTKDRRQRIWLEDAQHSTATILCLMSFVLCPSKELHTNFLATGIHFRTTANAKEINHAAIHSPSTIQAM